MTTLEVERKIARINKQINNALQHTQSDNDFAPFQSSRKEYYIACSSKVCHQYKVVKFSQRKIDVVSILKSGRTSKGRVGANVVKTVVLI